MKNAFTFSFLILLFSANVFAQEEKPKPISGSGSGIGSGRTLKDPDGKTDSGIRIISKPRPEYTDSARTQDIEGSVMLRVMFLSDGKIGEVSVVSGLPHGLTEQAIKAARKLVFEPAYRNGVPVTVVKRVQYNFSIIYEEDDLIVAQKPIINDLPEAERPAGEEFKNLSGSIKAVVLLKSDGGISVVDISTNLPREFIEKAVEAAGRIKFTPALRGDGRSISVLKSIEFEFKPID